MSLVLGVIPARYASTRFPGKALASLDGKPMIEHVWRRAGRAERIDRLIVATDDQRILDAGIAFGAEVKRTSREHLSGTDRVAEVVRGLQDSFDIVINIQGDEPLLEASSLDRLVACFDEPEPPSIATLAEPIESIAELFDPNVVKLVADERGRALYFSRSPIPYFRGADAPMRTDFSEALAARSAGLAGYRKHQGIYAYRVDALLELTRRETSLLEKSEGLEQLRALQAGFSIRIVDSDFRSLSVDTPADLERVARILAETTR